MADSKKKNKGYHLVCPDFGTDGAKPSDDIQVRCLSYILEHVNEIISVPPGVHFEIIPLRWHHFGEAYPSIGMTGEPETEFSQDMTRLSMAFGDQITEFINTLGLDKLVELSLGEKLSWADVLKQHET